MQYIIEVRDESISGTTASGKPWPPAYWRGPAYEYVTGTKVKAHRFGSRDCAEQMAKTLNNSINNHTFKVIAAP